MRLASLNTITKFQQFIKMPSSHKTKGIEKQQKDLKTMQAPYLSVNFMSAHQGLISEKNAQSSFFDIV